MSEQRTIRGQTVMRWEDQARSALRPIVRYMILFSLAMIAALVLVWSITSSDEDWLLLRHEPRAAFALILRDSWPFFASGVALVLALLVAVHGWSFHHLPEPSRLLSYEANRDGIVTRDAADFALSVPWSSVVSVRSNDYMMRMRLAAGGSRVVFWRAFAPEDREQVLSWARRAATQAPATDTETTREP